MILLIFPRYNTLCVVLVLLWNNYLSKLSQWPYIIRLDEPRIVFCKRLFISQFTKRTSQFYDVGILDLI